MIIDDRCICSTLNNQWKKNRMERRSNFNLFFYQIKITKNSAIIIHIIYFIWIELVNLSMIDYDDLNDFNKVWLWFFDSKRRALQRVVLWLWAWEKGKKRKNKTNLASVPSKQSNLKPLWNQSLEWLNSNIEQTHSIMSKPTT